MQTQDAPAELIFKFWPWLEANKTRLIAATAAAVLAFIAWLFISSQQQQKIAAAGEAYTQFQLNQPATVAAKQVADGYLQIAGKYSGTMAGERAQLQAAVILFSGNNFADAQKQFESFLAANSSSPLAVLAQLGLAASLEAQGKLDAALAAYRTAASAKPDSSEAVSAKFAQARILEAQGKLTEAVAIYQEVARSPFAGTLASESGRQIALLQAKPPAPKPAAK